jgi:sugar phosphate isomerase/epimerase
MVEHFEITKEFGMRFLEFGIGGGQIGRLPEAPTAEEVRLFLEMGERFGIQTPFCCLENDFTLADTDEHVAMVTKVLAQMQVAKECGATHVRLFAGFTHVDSVDEAHWERLIAAFATCDTRAQELGLTIAIETHGGIRFLADGSAEHYHSVSTEPQALQRLLKELPSEVGFNYDPGNLKAVYPEDRSYALSQLNDRINYCHLKDWRVQGNGWVAVAIGDDDLDYGPVLSNMTFDGVFLIEYEPLHDCEDGIRRSLDYLSTLDSIAVVL